MYCNIPVRSGDPDNYEGRAAAYYWQNIFGKFVDFNRHRGGAPPNNRKSAYQLALDIKRSKNYISSAENPNSANRINVGDYPAIAVELEIDIHSIIPPDDWKVSDSHEKVDKVVDSLTDPSFAKRVLEGIKASKYADRLNDLDKLYRHLSTKDAAERATVKKVWEEFRG